MKKSVLLNGLMDGTIFLTFVASLAQSIFVALFIALPFYITLAIALLYFLVLCLLFLRPRLTLILALGIAIVAVLFLFRKPYSKDFLNRAIQFFNWSIYYPLGLSAYNETMIRPLVYLIIGLISLIFYITFIRLRFHLIPLVFGALLLGIEWFLGHSSISPYIWIFAFSVILIMASRHHVKLSSSVESNLADYGLWLLFTIPFGVMAIFSTSILLPKDTHTLKWSKLENLVEDIRKSRFEGSSFTQPRKPFRLSSTGFTQSDNQLGGPVKLDGEIVLQVHSSLPTYLRGSIFNHYTGTSWQDTIVDHRYRVSQKNWSEYGKRAFDMDEPLWKDSKVLDIYINEGLVIPFKINIKHVGIKTSVLFNAQFLKNIRPEYKKSFIAYFNTKGESFTTRDLQEEEVYILEGIAPNLDNIRFRDFVNKYSNQSPTSQKENVKLSKVDYIIQNYTQIPESLPKTVSELALSIVRYADTPYDKAIKLQNYLKENYLYSLKTPLTPPNRDFVDYFLFDLKEGYCTYFATAMAIMGRTVGLPTRYIEGFSMPPNAYRDNLYNIRKSDAHAWVEIYFPNIGWLPFDPTPRAQEDITPNPALNTYSSYEDYWNQHLRDYEGYDEYQHNQNLDFSVDGAEFQAETRKGLLWYLLIIILLLIGLLFTLGVWLILWHHLTKIQIKKYSNPQKLMYYYGQILWLLKLYGFPQKPGETPYDYAKRVDAWLINKKTSMWDITHIVVQCQFASIEPKPQQIQIIEKLYRDMRQDIIDIVGLHIFLFEALKKFSPLIRVGESG